MKKSLFTPIALLAVMAAAIVVAPGALAKTQATSSIVHLTAKKSGLAYNTKTLTAKAGRIKIVFTNLSPLMHNVRIELGETELGGTKKIATGTTTAYVTLKKGKYHYYCSVPGHEDAGMSGYITVTT